MNQVVVEPRCRGDDRRHRQARIVDVLGQSRHRQDRRPVRMTQELQRRVETVDFNVPLDRDVTGVDMAFDDGPQAVALRGDQQLDRLNGGQFDRFARRQPAGTTGDQHERLARNHFLIERRIVRRLGYQREIEFAFKHPAGKRTAVGLGDTYVDIRVFARIVRQDLRQRTLRYGWNDACCQRSGNFARPVVHALARRLDIAQYFQTIGIKAFSGGCRHDATRLPVKQGQAEFLFELAHLHADAGLRAVEAFRCLVDAALLDNGCEGTHLAQIHAIDPALLV